jgi:hypothetical protein
MSPTLEQRRRSLQIANERRMRTAAMKRDILAGHLVLADAVFDDRADTLMVGDFLELAPGWGPTSARKVLGDLAAATAGTHEIKLWPWARMADLSPRQRKALHLYLASCGWRGLVAHDGRRLEIVGPEFKAKPQNGEFAAVRVVVDWIRKEFPNCSICDIERQLGLNDGTVRRWFREEDKEVLMTSMDKALTHIGRPDLLNQLFPLT